MLVSGRVSSYFFGVYERYVGCKHPESETIFVFFFLAGAAGISGKCGIMFMLGKFYRVFYI